MLGLSVKSYFVFLAVLSPGLLLLPSGAQWTGWPSTGHTPAGLPCHWSTNQHRDAAVMAAEEVGVFTREITAHNLLLAVCFTI